jgi:CubicO group peptidase (beta-lactamase class C family)
MTRLASRRLALAAAVIGAAAAITLGQAAAKAPAAPPARAQACAEITAGLARSLAPGVALTVSRGGSVLWRDNEGLADVELGVPVSPGTRFRIGSVSKPLTAAALGILVEEGKLDLDAPVQRYVPDFPLKAWPITSRQLAGHTAGIRHYRGGEFMSREAYATVRAGLVMFENDPLLFEPGTQMSYSSYGYNLLSAVIEGASGEPFLAFMQRRVFGPAGMTRTAPDQAEPILSGRASFYTLDDAGRLVNAGFVDNSYKWAGGGFLSTADDLVAFGNALLEGRLVKPETLALLWTSQKTADGKDTEYGMGWTVDRDTKGRARVRHSGGAQGGTANLVIYPEQRLVVAMLVNSDESFTGRAPQIAEMFLDER